jgi:PAS domain S-box-containing protein
MALRLSLYYAIAGALWILFSDQLLHQVVSDPEQEALWSTLKGWFFIAVTASILWLGLDRYFRQIRHSAELLEESERRWQFVLEGTGQGVWDWEAQTQTVFYSPRWAQILGYEAEEVGNSMEDWKNRIHPEDSMKVLKALEDHLKRETPEYVSEYRIRCKDGSFKWVLDRGKVMARAGDGKPLRVLGSLSDISTRKQAEEALRSSEERYRGLVETTCDWVWEVDVEGRYTYCSPQVQKLLGYTPPEVVGHSPSDFMPEAEAKRVTAIFKEIAKKREPFQGLENTNSHKDGHLVVLETSGVPVFASDGTFTGYRGTDRDITERKRLEEQLRQAQKLEAVGQLAGGVAHDFNNILAAIMMQLGLLQMDSKLEPKVRQALKDLEAGARRAASLTRQLLMFSRRSVMTVRPLDLNELVLHLIKMLTRLIGEQIDLRFDRKSSLPLVEADAGMIEQVLVNLVVNARDAMPRGGRVTLVTEEVCFRAEDVSPTADRRPGRFVCLSVSDTGSGMDPATLKRIFEPFFTTKEVGKGSGLGLATAHGIVAQHNGWIEVESNVGVGSTFRVFLPASSQPSVLLPANPVSDRIRGGSETILLVEDETEVRKVIGKTLRALGYKVLEAGNGQAAVVAWQEQDRKVDLLLTDMVMPEGMTGLELAEHLQSLKPGLKAIISSGYSAGIPDPELQKKKGIIYLPKPYSVDVLSKIVRQSLETEH